MEIQKENGATITNSTVKTANIRNTYKDAAINAFIKRASESIKDPIKTPVPTETYREIGEAIVAAIEQYTAPLITAYNTHKHKIVIEDMGIDMKSDVSDTPIQ